MTVGGQSLSLFTDTGGGLEIFPSTIKRPNLKVRKIEMDGQITDAASLPSFAPGNSIPAVATPGGLLPVAAEDNGPGTFIVHGHDGLLGQAWFRGRTWTFDYPEHRLLLRAPGDLPPHTPRQVIPLGFQTNAAGVRQTNYPRLQVQVAGMTLDLLFDTGASTQLEPKARQAIHDGRPAVRATSFIVASVFDRWHHQHPNWRIVEHAEEGTGEAMIEVPQVQVAGDIIGPVWFTRRPDPNFHEFMSQFMDKQIDGALGGNALRHFCITVDYPKAIAVFERPSVIGRNKS